MRRLRTHIWILLSHLYPNQLNSGKMVFADMSQWILLFSFFVGAFSSPLQGLISLTSAQSSPAPIPYSLLGPPKPINPVIPNPPPNPIPPAPRPENPVCPPTLGKPTLQNCIAATALIPRDPRDNPVLRNFYVRESDRNSSMENIQLPYEKTVG